ncbi:MAG: hypothetical protein JO021_19200 [Alphaproteobacteria bacterium]|nr:hypothetical protein [Alphaproteobacteria bacterium]
MGMFDFLYVDEKAKAQQPVAVPAGPPRHRAPIFSVVLDNTESGKTASWGTDGVDVRGIQQRFPTRASIGGTILEGVKFVGSFTATVTGPTDDVLSLKFAGTDKALTKRLAQGPAPATKPKR